MAWGLSLSNRDPEKEYDNLTDALEFAFEQLLKRMWSCIPGIIESYDPVKKRCRVRPAINIRETDGSTSTPSPIVNVPVVWPSGGGFSLISPLPEGEPVLIQFSQRGITQFKELFSQSDPGDGLFAKEDAIVQPAFGGLSITPATIDGISMQDDAGENYIYIEDGLIKVKSTTKIITEAPDIDMIGEVNILTGNVNILAGNINMTAGSIVLDDGTITGPNVFGGASSDNHGHTQGIDSANNTQQKTDGPS